MGELHVSPASHPDSPGGRALVQFSRVAEFNCWSGNVMFPTSTYNLYLLLIKKRNKIIWLNSLLEMQIQLKFHVNRIKIEDFRNCTKVVDLWPMLTFLLTFISKIIGGSIE